MKRIIGLFLGISILVSCKKSEVVSEFTGNQTTYALQAGSQYSVSGTVTFKERKDGAVTVLVKLTGTSEGTTSPVHLHLGNLNVEQADVAALLSPVIGKSGESETILKELADESMVNYNSLQQLDACIKVHLSDVGDGRNVILAAGNIGTATSDPVNDGRIGVAICK